jgi:16S rRNA (guanine966-N2)-methyltransferase
MRSHLTKADTAASKGRTGPAPAQSVRANRRGAPASRTVGQGRIRIIGGQWRGRKIEVSASPGLRPTPDRVRGTLFNWLGQDLAGLQCLDLFAGSGALGFEAASRGADRVVMVERDSLLVDRLTEFRDHIGAVQVEIRRADALRFLRGANEVFDVVFLDPPFGQNLLPLVVDSLAGRLAPGARIYLESDRPIEPEALFRELRRARAGAVSYQLWECMADDSSRLSRDL